MSDSQSQSALREWRAYMTRRATMLAVLGAAGIVTLAAPFNTDALLSFGPRGVYWLIMITLTFSAGSLTTMVLMRHLSNASLLTRTLVIGLSTSVSVMAVVLSVNAVTFGWLPPAEEFPIFVGTLIGMTIIITAGFQYLDMHAETHKQSAPAQSTPDLPPLLDRLPLDKRGALLSLSVEDHYVRIKTSNGEELILMRLSDAIREVGDTRGDQVHRSHWVSFDAVTSARREGDRAFVSLSDGTEIPVSRANVKKIKEAGLLPR